MLAFFFFNDTATTEIYTLSLHDALPICLQAPGCGVARQAGCPGRRRCRPASAHGGDRKSTRLNSSHLVISYAVFCLKKQRPTSRTTSRRRPCLSTLRSICRGRRLCVLRC